VDRAPGDDLIDAPLALRLGGRIRERRNALGQTLVQTAGQAGISVSHLSAVETGGNVPSLGILARIATALDLSLNELLRDVGGDSAIREERVDASVPGARIVSHDDLQLRIAVVAAEPGERGDAPLPAGGELFVHVVRGSFDLTVDGDAHLLRVGDSLDADAPASVTWRCAGRGRAVAVWATRPGEAV
jgi:transcriptional regulator with XRE-family HTH domain